MFIISAECDGIRYPQGKFMFYSKREAIRLYKAKHGLKGKHNVILSYFYS